MRKRTNMGMKLTHLVFTPFAFEKAALPAVRNLFLCYHKNVTEYPILLHGACHFLLKAS